MSDSTPQENQDDQRQKIQQVIKGRCTALGTPLSVFGTKESAVLLLEALADSSVTVLGVFDRDPQSDTFMEHSLRPLEALADLPAESTLIVASTASSVELQETLDQIHGLFPGRVICLEELLNLARLFEGLKKELDYKYDHYILAESSRHMHGEISPWPHIPEGFTVHGKTVLELGPFEGLLTLMLMQQKPKRVFCVEGRPDNYAKTASLKAYFDWSDLTLRFGDMHLFPSIVPEPVDVIFCSGVLYHSPKPWWFLKTCLDHCDTIVLGTQVASEHSPKGRKFKEVELEPGLFRFEVFHEGGDNLSGLSPYSLWFFEEDLKRFVNHYGFSYKKHTEWVNPEGLWINTLLTRL